MQTKDYEYFAKNMSSFYKKYGQKFLALKGQKVIGVYDSFGVAFRETTKKEKLGTFLIQECFKNEKESVLHFQSNVSFAIGG